MLNKYKSYDSQWFRAYFAQTSARLKRLEAQNPCTSVENRWVDWENTRQNTIFQAVLPLNSLCRLFQQALIINLLTQQGRLNRISNDQIKEFKQKYFTNKVKRRLTSNEEDREHIPVVLLSDRKYALTLDEKFTADLLNFPSFTATIAKKPSGIPYDQK